MTAQTSNTASRSTDQNNVFPSKRDTWLVLLLWAIVIGGTATIMPLLTGNEPTAAKLGVGLLVAATNVLVLWVLYGTFYFIEQDDLQIRCGPVRMVVPMAEIESVSQTRSPLSSPACSLDRLRICYGKSQVLISPRDQDGFLRRLAERCPDLAQETTE